MSFQLFLAGFLLFSVWIVALLSAADVLIDFRRLGALRRRWTPLSSADGTGLVVGTIVEGKGPDGVFAVHHLEQRVRALDRPNTLGFWDRTRAAELFGGTVSVGSTSVKVDAQPAQVWPSDERQAQALPLPATQFAALAGDAQKAAGALRRLDTPLKAQDTVYLAGTFRNGVLGPAPDGGLLVSAVDPNGWASARQNLCLGFVALAFGWASLGTALAVGAGEPWGLVSKLGAVVLIALFLGLTPLCVKVRNACKTPDERDVGGTQAQPTGLPHPA